MHKCPSSTLRVGPSSSLSRHVSRRHQMHQMRGWHAACRRRPAPSSNRRESLTSRCLPLPPAGAAATISTSPLIRDFRRWPSLDSAPIFSAAPTAVVKSQRRRATTASSSFSSSSSSSLIMKNSPSENQRSPSTRSHLAVAGYLEPFVAEAEAHEQHHHHEDGLPSNVSSYFSLDYSSYLSHLRWMVQKDQLKQDILLAGPAEASLYKRRLALAWTQLLGRNAHVLTITSDLTESDLKQRRELVRCAVTSDDLTAVDASPALQLVHHNASPVDAALHGDVLILDGIERASRNVLPTLNNLIEHRTMNLEDGRMLVPSTSLPLNAGINSDNRFVAVHPNFRVIATCVPPGLPGGKALDPPLRSRFQIRRVELPSLRVVDPAIAERNEQEHDAMGRQQSVVRFVSALDAVGRRVAGNESASEMLPVLHRPWPIHQLASTLSLVRTFPAQDPRDLLRRHYVETNKNDRTPSMSNKSVDSMGTLDRLWNETVRGAGRNNDRVLAGAHHHRRYRVEHVVRDPESPFQAQVMFVSEPNTTNDMPSAPHSVSLAVPCGPKQHMGDDSTSGGPGEFLCLTEGLQTTIASMLQSHGAGSDLLLLSPQGEGKSTAASYFCSLLGYTKSLVHCHPDMTLQDLFLRRGTNPQGETTWEPSALLAAIQQGHVCVLDHAHKLRNDVLAGLQSLCLDRDVWLPDGRRITAAPPSVDQDDNERIIRVHPSFRLVALGSSDGNMSWLTRDVQGMLSTIALPAPTSDCYRAVLHHATRGENPCPPNLVDKILRVRATLTPSVADDCGVLPLSTRNMIRVARQLASTSTASDLHQALWHVLVADLLPPSQKDSLNSVLRQVGVVRTVSRSGGTTGLPNESPTIEVDATVCRIGDFSMPRRQARRPELVPSPNFFDIPSHVHLLKDLLQSWTRGERAFLLLGNQGVGKNMVVDRLCQVSNFEREYVQLHRDSTVGQLTLQPSLEGGRIVWNDSPLVRAVSEGRLLVVDEADKAPTDVLAVLKGLIEDGELLLGDGRRISRHESSSNIVEIHPDFTLFVLANRPGFPFLGNPFFKQVGDCFASRVVANPDVDSEIRLLKSYGPNVDETTLMRIATSFAELRSQSEYGELTYPYSTREAVAVVKHLERFPGDGIVSALHNVIDFDSFDHLVYATLSEVFERNGIPMKSLESWHEAIRLQGHQLKRNQWAERMVRERSLSLGSNPPSLSSPKEGKWDDKNEAHVGGNQWAGGTGGSDTAGLGGRGGPYRLDRGHPVHQVSDEAKAQVSPEAAAAARAMAQRALQDRLQEIEMSETEWKMYHRFVDSIQKEIQTLKAMLGQADVRQSDQRWLTRQSHGELDEMRLVEGVTGAKNIYKRLGRPSDPSAVALEPKRLHFVVDVSGSMYRFNGHDGRLTRCLEATSMVMESLSGNERMFEYRIVGHSGDSSNIRFVEAGAPPPNEKQRLRILQMMVAHSQYCQSGDNTLEALAEAMQEASDDNDVQGGGGGGNPLVIAISDANLERYGIHPRALGRIIGDGNGRGVISHCIFIASFGNEAESILRELPVGRGHVCYHTSDLPRIVKNIIAAQV